MNVNRIRFSTWQLLIVITLCACGCAPHRDFKPAKELAELRQAAEKLDWRRERFTVGTLHGTPFQLAMQECGPESADTAFVFLHGVVSDSRVWRLVCAGMPPDSLRICIDNLGCGRSDTPDALKAPQIYSLPAMARQTLEVLRQWKHKRGDKPTRLTLVAHSLGGQIALLMLGDPKLREDYVDVVDDVRSAVLFAPFDPTTFTRQPAYEPLSKNPDPIWWLLIATGQVRERGAYNERMSVDPRRQLPEDNIIKVETLSNTARRHAMKAVIEQAYPLCDKSTPDKPRPDWDRIHELETNYARVQIPCLIVWGYEDELISHAGGHDLLASLPDARLRIIVGCKHQIPIEQPRISTNLIADFVRTSGQEWPAIAEIDGMSATE